MPGVFKYEEISDHNSVCQGPFPVQVGFRETKPMIQGMDKIFPARNRYCEAGDACSKFICRVGITPCYFRQSVFFFPCAYFQIFDVRIPSVVGFDDGA